ncbi:protein BatD [Aureimonas fodinaquatilis]|uniref:Protein BatD n=1 Tax=Aureimonas fodinaquatilis TaxID=2565783 RepID=A0A5B0DRS9_9HYPH|nr:BatD family protein [Aureimonas fodinaquatilis]KAA0969504.1 protein BatD [Aureimonas fodinaquatilis]
MVRHLLPLCLSTLLVICVTPVGAQQTVASLTVVPDEMAQAPYVGEMILATVEGRYNGLINRQKLTIPPLEQFDWMQLGEESWSEELIDGRPVKLYHQRIALYPRKSGSLSISPFTHNMILTDLKGDRVETEVRSSELVLEVQPAPKVQTGAFLPARAVRISDDWSVNPEQIQRGQSTIRTVTLEAEGLPPQSLPVAPPMHAGGLFTFNLPEQRLTRLTPDGPVSTVIWQYEMQPQSDAPANLADIPVNWFNTATRQGQASILAGREIAFEGKGGLMRQPSAMAMNLPLWGGLAGVFLGCILAVPAMTMRRGKLGWKARCALIGHHLALRFHLWRRHTAKARPHVISLLQLTGQKPETSISLKMIDQALYARHPSIQLDYRTVLQSLRAGRHMPV